MRRFLKGGLRNSKNWMWSPILKSNPYQTITSVTWNSRDILILQAALTPRSQLIGYTLKETHFREKFGMLVLAVWNGQRTIRTGLSDLKLSYGDALLLQGPRERLPMLRSSNELIVLSTEENPLKKSTKKAPLAGRDFRNNHCIGGFRYFFSW